MKIEPPADMREMATAHFQLFVAYVDAGFTPEQALGILSNVIIAGLTGQQG